MRKHFPRHFEQYPYQSASDVLAKMRGVREQIARADVSDAFRNLRTSRLKRVREQWQACLFVHGISSLMKRDIYLASAENQDYDFITRWQQGDFLNFAPLQMKELVPGNVQPRATLQGELEKLKKYGDSSDLIVAMYLNRRMKIDLDLLRIPSLRLAQVWLFGASREDGSEFMVYGNLLGSPVYHTYQLPEPNYALERPR